MTSADGVDLKQCRRVKSRDLHVLKGTVQGAFLNESRCTVKYNTDRIGLVAADRSNRRKLLNGFSSVFIS